MEGKMDHNFPEGIRVLVVDDDPLDLKALRKILVSCSYKVTTCRNPRSALTLLRERPNAFDLLLADIHMPEFSGFELLTIVKDELDLPTILMSKDSRLETMKITHELGACFFVVKPLDPAIARNLWQHIICNARFQREKLISKIGESGSQKMPHADAILNDESERMKNRKGKKVVIAETASRPDFPNLKNMVEMRTSNSEGRRGTWWEGIPSKDENGGKTRKTRLWDEHLEQKFCFTVQALGQDAVPTKIMKHMNVKGITRAQIASHLQKHRLRRKNGQSIPLIPTMLTSGTEMAQFEQASNQNGLLTAQGFLDSFTLKPPVPANQMVPFGLQLSPNFNNYPNLSSIQSHNDNSLLHQNTNASQNQLASNFGMTEEMPVLHSTSSLANNTNNFMGFGGGIPQTFEADIQAQQLNSDIQFSSSFGASTNMQQFNSSIQVPESCGQIHQPQQLLNGMVQISDSDGDFSDMISEYMDIGLHGSDSNPILCNASEQHTHLVSTNAMTTDAHVDGTATSANQFSITDSEQQHNTSGEKTLLVSGNTNDGTLDGAVKYANQSSVNNSEKQDSGSNVVGNSSKVVEEENLNHITESFAGDDDIWSLKLADSFDFDFISRNLEMFPIRHSS